MCSTVSSTNRRRFSALVLTATIMTAGAPGNPATANFVNANTRGWTSCVPFTPTNARPCMIEAFEISSWSEIPPGRMANALFSTVYAGYNSTDVEFFPASGHLGVTDVVWRLEPIAGDVIGQYRCLTNATGWRCEHAHILFDPGAAEDLADQWLRALACHETGHSIGLTHAPDGIPFYGPQSGVIRCMATPLLPDSYIGPHNVMHISANYP